MSKTPQIKDGHAFVQNRRALFEFEVIESLEAGLALVGSEVSSIRDGKCSLNEGYCQVNARRGMEDTGAAVEDEEQQQH